jgi:hypothetical protein
MTGSDLIVEIPWILFGLFLVGIGFRLRRFRRFTGQPPSRQVQPSDEDRSGDSSARSYRRFGREREERADPPCSTQIEP